MDRTSGYMILLIGKTMAMLSTAGSPNGRNRVKEKLADLRLIKEIVPYQYHWKGTNIFR